MTAHIITIGTELLIGDIVNTNAARIGEMLSAAGIHCEKAVTVGDDQVQIIRALDESLKTTAITVVTGGLGPTHDDVTKKCLTEYFKVNLKRDEPTLYRIQEVFKRRNIPFSRSNYGQADVPENCEVMINKAGTAPGMWFASHNLAVLPGVPFEMMYLMENEVLPRIRKIFPATGSRITKYFQLTGIGESALSDLSLDKIPTYLNESVKLAYLPAPSGVTLRIDVTADKPGLQLRHIEPLERYIREKAGDFIYSEKKDEGLNAVTGRLLSGQGKTLAVAESCTGGYLSNYITDIPGSSQWFTGGILAYSNALKVRYLDVPEADLIRYGAVSKPVALKMARTAAENLGSDIGVSTTGIAGPGGGSETKPVGTVWIGYYSLRDHFAVKLDLYKDRLLNKERTAIIVLDLIRRRLSGIDGMPYGLRSESA